MLKAELELMKGATEASSLDLEQVRNLLDLCTGKDVNEDITMNIRRCLKSTIFDILLMIFYILFHSSSFCYLIFVWFEFTFI